VLAKTRFFGVLPKGGASSRPRAWLGGWECSPAGQATGKVDAPIRWEGLCLTLEPGLQVAINKNKINDNALKFIQKGQIKKAIREYEKILAEDPSDVRTLLKKGDLLVRVGEKEHAVDTYLMVASTYSQQGFHLKAVAVFKQILKIDDARIDVNLHLADEYQNLGIVGDAMSHLQVVAAHYEQQELVRESLDILRRIVDLDPDNIASRIKLAEMYSREEMIPDAVEEFTRAAEDLKASNRIEDYVKVAERLIYHDNSNVALIKELANIYLQRGDTKRALGKLQICFKSDPRDLEVLGMLAMAFQELNQLSKTVSVFKEMAKIYQEQGAMDEMQQVYQRVLEIIPDDPEANSALSHAPPPVARPSGAEMVMDPGVQEMTLPTASIPMPSSPDDEQTAFEPDIASQVTMEQGFVEEFNDLDDDDEEVIIQESYSVDQGEEIDEEATVGETMTVQEVLPEQEMSGQTEDARETISRLLTETEVYIKYGLQNKAFDHLSKIFQLDPNNIEAHEKLKDIYVAANQLDHAGQELLTLVHLNNHLGRIADARSHLRALLTMFPNHGEGLTLAGQLDVQAPLVAEPPTLAEQPQELDPSAPDLILQDQDSTIEIGAEEAMDLVDDMSIDVVTDDLVEDDEGEAPTMIADRAALDYELSQDSEPAVADFDLEAEKASMDLEYDASEETVDASVLTTGLYPAENEEPDAGIDEPMDEYVSDSLEEPEVVELVEEPLDLPDASPVHMIEDDELIEFTGEEEFFTEERPRALEHPASPPPLDDAQLEPEAVFEQEPEPSALDMVEDFESIEEPEDLGRPAPILDEFDPSEMSTQVGMGISGLRGEQAGDLSPEPVRAPPEPTIEAQAADLSSAPELEAPPPLPMVDAPVRPSDGAAEDWDQQTAPGGHPASTPEVAEEEETASDEDLEDALEEIDFFIQQNLLDEASDELGRLKEEHPGNALVQERVDKVERLRQGEAPAAQVFTEEIDGPFDLAAEIEREVGDDVAPVPLDEDFQYSFDDVFSEFKKGVEKVVDKEDSATHFDLGIAYKEMGLVDDAINEFGIAAQDDARKASALNMIGICFQEKGQYSEAINRFKDALHGPGISDQEATGVYYEIGRTYELLDDLKEAAFYFKKVQKRDAGFRDVVSKLQKFSKTPNADQEKGKEEEEKKKPASSKSNISYM
jgi:pilus assembly protein FimV